MTKATLRNHYIRHSAADSYIVGFTEKHMVYMAKMPEIAPRFITIEEASRQQGQALRLRIKKAHRDYFMKKGAICLGPDSILNDETYNKGEMFEKAVTEYFGQVWEKDTIPFWVQGDIRVNDEEIQIKFDGASLLTTKQVAKNFYKRQRKGA